MFLFRGGRGTCFLPLFYHHETCGHLVLGYSLYYTQGESCRLRKVVFSFTLLKQVKLTARRQCVFDAELVQEVLNIYLQLNPTISNLQGRQKIVRNSGSWK